MYTCILSLYQRFNLLTRSWLAQAVHLWCIHSPSLVRGHRLGPADDELYQRTTVTVMQKEQHSEAVIYSYSPQGFNIDGNRVIGPCAVIPPAILQWNVNYFNFSKTSQKCMSQHFCQLPILICWHLSLCPCVGWQFHRHHH